LKRIGLTFPPFFFDEKGNEKRFLNFLKEEKFKGEWNMSCNRKRFSLFTTKKPAEGFFSPVSKRIIDHVFERAKEKTVLELEKQVSKAARIFREHVENYGKIF